MQWHLLLPQSRALLRVSDILVSKKIRKKMKIQHSSSPHVSFFMSFFFFCLMPVQAWLDLQLTLKCKGRESSWLVWGQNPTSKEWKGSSVERTLQQYGETVLINAKCCPPGEEEDWDTEWWLAQFQQEQDSAFASKFDYFYHSLY